MPCVNCELNSDHVRLKNDRWTNTGKKSGNNVISYSYFSQKVLAYHNFTFKQFNECFCNKKSSCKIMTPRGVTFLYRESKFYSAEVSILQQGSHFSMKKTDWGVSFLYRIMTGESVFYDSHYSTLHRHVQIKMVF